MKKFIVNTWNKLKYTTGLVVGVLYVLYDTFLKSTNIASNAAVMQLEDSDVTYATGMALANGTGSTLVFLESVVVSIYCFFKLFLTTKEIKKI